ncbi:hypothetical protein [Agaribacterium sp. ZY112]|uniref:RICIN domain-containing protein n=1 Tax=Agaribacterium sp. ZY112 TaxID=3233574 RepID=UPI003524ECCE
MFRLLSLFRLVFVSAAVLLFSNISFSQEASLTFYSSEGFSGAQLEFHGEQRVLEARRAASAPTIVEFQDFFFPVGLNNISSLEVAEGYCAILASDEFFRGRWGVYAPGAYSSLGNMNNTVESALAYKKRNNTCDPLVDLAILYENANFTGDKFPIAVESDNRLASLNERYYHEWTNGPFRHRSRLYTSVGGFSFIGSSLTVPSCYEVELFGSKANSPFNNNLRSESHDFEPGSYSSLSPYGLENWSAFATAKLAASCAPIVASGLDTDSHNPSLADGLVRIESFWKNDKGLNITDGDIAANATTSNQLSAVWQLEPVEGDFFRIRSLWRPSHYLHIDSGVVESGVIQGHWQSAQWQLIRDGHWEGLKNANGGHVYRIQSRSQPGLFLHIENGDLEAGEVGSAWWSSRWNVHAL